MNQVSGVVGKSPCPLNRTVGSRWTLLAIAVIAISVALPRLLAEEGVTSSVTLKEMLDLVLAHNESLQVKILEAQIGQKTYESEKGIFEPHVVGSVERNESRRENNTQQLLSLGFSPTAEFSERNTLYHGGLQLLAPTGARIDAGYNLRELSNSLQQGGKREYETFVGLNISQPLLKNFGPGATMARLRIAALGSDIAFQEYRRHLMLLVAQVESSYWDLYLAQEQERLSEESVTLSRKILEDNRARSEVGLSTELEVLQAQAQLVLRQTRNNEARLKVFEQGKRLSAFYSDAGIRTGVFFRVIDKPEVHEFELTPFNNYQMAFSLNPDYWIRMRQVDQEVIKVKYAGNQRMPQLDLKGSYGFNGLGSSAGASLDRLSDTTHPAWTLGVEMRIPITGGIRERKDLEAAELARKRALANLKDAESQIAGSLDSGIQRVKTFLKMVESYQSMVDIHQKLLDAQLAQLEVGHIDTRSVMETEEKLFESKVSVIERLVLYRKSLLELELARGSTLQARGLEVRRGQLERTTLAALREPKMSNEELERARKLLLKEMQQSSPSNTPVR